jgi:hypothetical protein
LCFPDTGATRLVNCVFPIPGLVCWRIVLPRYWGYKAGKLCFSDTGAGVLANCASPILVLQCWHAAAVVRCTFILGGDKTASWRTFQSSTRPMLRVPQGRHLVRKGEVQARQGLCEFLGQRLKMCTTLRRPNFLIWKCNWLHASKCLGVKGMFKYCVVWAPEVDWCLVSDLHLQLCTRSNKILCGICSSAGVFVSSLPFLSLSDVS